MKLTGKWRIVMEGDVEQLLEAFQHTLNGITTPRAEDE